MKYNIPLSQICKIILSGTPKTSVSKYWNGDIKWVTPSDITKINERYIHDTERKITKVGIENSSAKLLKKNTIIISARGTVGELCIIPSEMSCNQSCYALEVFSEIVRPLYLFYVLKNLKSTYDQIAHGTTFDTITKITFDEIEINLPSLDEQDKLIPKLDSLDSQIENLQNQNKILEQISQAVFKSWFIDFDGVTKFENSELGQIPKGWRVEKLENLIELINGVSYRSTELMPSNTALVTLKSVKRGGGYTERGLKSFEGKYKENQIICEGDIIIAKTDLTQDAEVIGKPALIRNSKEFNLLIASLDLVIVRTKNNYIPKSYLYNLFLRDEFQNHVYGYTSGTTVLHLAKDGIPNYQIILPPKKILEKFDESISIMMQKNHENNYQINNLTKIRDVLLPKLISGEIKV